MATDTKQKDQENQPSPLPKEGGINPSAPSVGTAGWGTTNDERNVVGSGDAAATRAGQMKGNPGDNMTEASNRASEAATSNKKPEKPVAE